MNKLFVLLLICVIAAFAIAADVEITKFGEWTELTPLPAKDFGPHWFITLPPEQPTREVIVYMRSAPNSPESFDPDLYGKYDTFPSRSDADQTDTSLTELHRLVFRDTAQLTAGRKIYIGAYCYSSVVGSVQIKVDVSGCQHDNCGQALTPPRGTCLPTTGQCQCNPGFTQLPYCQAADQVAELDKSYSLALEPQQIMYYKYTLPTVKAKGYFKLHVTRTGTSRGSVHLLAKHGSIPTTSDFLVQDWMFSFHNEAAINLDDNHYSSGALWVAVIAPNNADVSVTVQGSVYFCPANCSSHGTCNKDESTCTCESHYSILPDCSVRSAELHFSETQAITLDSYARQYFTVPINKELADLPIEVGITLAVNMENPPATYGWPKLYLTLPDSKIRPSTTHYDFTGAVPTHHNQTLYISDSQVVEGTYHLLIENPNAHSYQYAVSLLTRPHCPHGCHQHGRCHASLPECICDKHYTGASCGVTVDQCRTHTGKHVISAFGLFCLAIILAALAGAISIFVFLHFFYKPPTPAVPDIQYDPLSN